MEPSAAEWAAALTADQCEEIFHATLTAGDTRGVDGALRLLAVKDPRRAQRLFDQTKAALRIAQGESILSVALNRD